MSTIAAWAAKQSGVAGAGGGAHAQARKAYLAAMKRYMQGPPHAAVYALYPGVGGEMELPMVAIENQHDGVRNAWADKQLMELTQKMVKAIQKEDASRALPGAARTFDYVLKKYGLKRTEEDAHDRAKHKQDSERLTRAMWDRCDAVELLAVFARAADATPRFNCHDMADAFLVAMECAVRRWTMYCKELRLPLTNTLAPGTIRVLGIDPGTRNLGVCLLELVGMQAPRLPADTNAELQKMADPEPVFRVLLLDLVDLKSTGDLAVVHHEAAAGSAPVRRPNHDHEDIGVLMKRAADKVAAKKAAAAQRKAAREAKKRECANADADEPPPAKKRKKEAAAVVRIDLT